MRTSIKGRPAIIDDRARCISASITITQHRRLYRMLVRGDVPVSARTRLHANTSRSTTVKAIVRRESYLHCSCGMRMFRYSGRSPG